MSFFGTFPTIRWPKTPLLFLTGSSLVCTQIPLFNYLGYEFSALTAVIASFAAGLGTLSLWKRWQRVQPRPEEGEVKPNADDVLVSFLKRLARFLVVLCALPAIILSLNALVVKNCSLAQGAALYGLLVLPSILFACALALVIAVSGSRWKRTWFVLLELVLLMDVIATTVARPQIFAFNPIIGFFPGITYDETLQIEGRLLLYRWATVSASILLFMIAVAIHRHRSRRNLPADASASPRTKLFFVGEWIAGILMLGVVGGVFFFSDELGLSSSIASIEQELGGKVETQHFIVVYPARAVPEPQARQLALLHEFYFAKLAQELRVESVRKIRSFLYATPEQKGRLIGAARTNIAKPWLWQIHLNLADVESSLKHELVHVMAAEFGFPLFRVGLNPGLIEGLAMAVERVQYDETIHRAAAQILALDLPVDLEELFSVTGFLKAHPGVSYSLAGSFTRFLIDQYGMRRFKRLYRVGDFRTVYAKDVTILTTEWKRHLVRYRVDEDERAKAAYLFKRPSLFGKECARVIANINAETKTLYERGEYQSALASATRSLQLSRNPEAVFQKTNCLLRLAQYREAIEFAEQALQDSVMASALLPLNLQLGDAWWAVGETTKARAVFAELLRKNISLTLNESLLLRLEVLKDPALAQQLLPYFVAAPTDSSKLAILHASFERWPQREIVLYLLAREYAAQGHERQGIELFRSFDRIPSDVLELQRQLRLARLEYGLGQFQRAKIHFWQSLNYTSSEALQSRIREWLDRCDWMTNPPSFLFEKKNGEWLSRFDEPNLQGSTRPARWSLHRIDFRTFFGHIRPRTAILPTMSTPSRRCIREQIWRPS